MCTSLAVGCRAAKKGALILARNEDFGENNKNKYMVYRHHAQYWIDDKHKNPFVENGTWTLGNGLKVKVPQKDYAYSAMPDGDGYTEAKCAIGDHFYGERFYFEERGINACNVMISATNSMDAKKEVTDADPFVSPGVSESIIPTLILPQVENAQAAVECLGGYIDMYGASEGNGILIGDPTEAWYLEVGSGHHWIAVRVPDDAYLAVANGMRINQVDLDDNKKVKYSTNLYEFVLEQKLLENPDRHQFDFARAFGIQGCREQADPWYNEDRIWLIQHILTPSLRQKPRQHPYPLFLKPDKSVSLKDVMSIMRATYAGTELEHAVPPPTRPIGVDRTTESHIMTFVPTLPDELKGMIWQAIGTPLGAPYMPVFNAMSEIPARYAAGENQYDPVSAYWAFRGLYTLAQVNNGEYLPTIKSMWSNQEAQFIDEHDYVVKMLSEMAQIKAALAADFAKGYSSGIACRMVELVDRKRDEIMTWITKEGEPLSEQLNAIGIFR